MWFAMIIIDTKRRWIEELNIEQMNNHNVSQLLF